MFEHSVQQPLRAPADNKYLASCPLVLFQFLDPGSKYAYVVAKMLFDEGRPEGKQ